MITSWTNEPATSLSPILAVHIEELRAAIEDARTGYTEPGEGWTSWTDDPVTNSTAIKAVHFSELRTAIQQLWDEKSLGTIPDWTERGGDAPSSDTPILGNDMNDLRLWFNLFESNGDNPPASFWGVDSVTPANDEFVIDTVSWTFYDWLTAEAGQAPAFWGRYIDAVNSPPLNGTEISFLRSKGCRIAILGVGFQSPHDFSDYDVGYSEAKTLAQIAHNLGIPKADDPDEPNVVIFQDIEADDAVEKAWLAGWTRAMYDSGYYYGFYCSPENSNFSTGFCEAVEDPVYNAWVKYTWIWGAKWIGCTVPSNWDDAPVLSCLTGNVVIWQYQGEDPSYCYDAGGGRAVDVNLANNLGIRVTWLPASS